MIVRWGNEVVVEGCQEQSKDPQEEHYNNKYRLLGCNYLSLIKATLTSIHY